MTYSNPDKKHLFYLIDINGDRRKIALKTIYKLVFNSNYCLDKIQSMDGEEWKYIRDTDNLYLVSNYGRIKSYQGYNARLMKLRKNNKGYLRVGIIIGGKRYIKYVSRLVA